MAPLKNYSPLFNRRAHSHLNWQSPFSLSLSDKHLNDTKVTSLVTRRKRDAKNVVRPIEF